MTEATIYRFPDGFLWGTATGAHHVEGDLTNSWSAWEEAGGHVFENGRHGRAAEWRFGRWREDFERLEYLNNKTHRLSVEWSRVQPEPDVWDEATLAQYSEWVDDLLKRGIAPMITLHHFTNPIWIEKQGGWLNPKTVDHFARFTEKVVQVLGDRVIFWCTFNEPMVYAVQAYLVGFFNPGGKNPWQMYQCAELLLRAHALVYEIIHRHNPNAQVGIAKHIVDFAPAAPRLINSPVASMMNRVFNHAFTEALLSGILEFPFRRRVIMPELAGTMDYFGLNFYQRYHFRLNPFQFPFIHQLQEPNTPPPPPLWGSIMPQRMFPILQAAYKHTQLPIYITESGIPTQNDEDRCWFIAHTVHAIWQAVNFNIPVKGLYYWSILDSFEWTAGYNPEFSFGLYGINRETQERIKRPSADFYREICTANGLSEDMVRRYIPRLENTLFPHARDTIKSSVHLPVPARV